MPRLNGSIGSDNEYGINASRGTCAWFVDGAVHEHSSANATDPQTHDERCGRNLMNVLFMKNL
jgi:hypothetical protein